MRKVLLVGFSGIGRQDHQTAMYAPAFAAHAGFQVVGVCVGPGESGAAAKDASAELGVPCFESLDAVDLDYEVASVAVAIEHRASVLTQLLRAGKAILADKPLAASATEAAAIAAEAAGLVLVPAHHQRLHGSVRSAIAALAGGRVGLPWNVQADFLVAGGDVAPTGELANLALYPVDVVHAMLGLKATRVFARSGRHWNSAADDFVALMIDYEHGVTGTITVGRTGPASDCPPGGVVRHRYRVSGSHGVLLTDVRKPALSLHTAAGQTRRWRPGGTVDALLDVLDRGIDSGRPVIGVADAVATHTIIDAAQRSLTTGTPERI